MTRRTVVVMRGDGIGPLVVQEALRVLDAVGFDADYVDAQIGWECWRRTGNPFPKETEDLLRTHRLGLFGAITSKRSDLAEADLRPDLQGTGLTYVSPVLQMRSKLQLETSIRPCVTLPGNPLNFIRKTPDGFEEPEINVALVTQNTEGLYSAVEWAGAPNALRAEIDTHRQMAAFAGVPNDEMALSVRVVTRRASERIARAAFEYAADHGHSRVTVCDKWGVMRATSGLFWEAVLRVAPEYPSIRVDTSHVDAQVMWLTRRPEEYGVILSTALIGDILSDGFAGLVGGLGFAHCANIGPDCAVFEPTHGSAPKYAELGTSCVNPCATILAAAMLLDSCGEPERAAQIRQAVARVVRDGSVRTYDLARVPGGADATLRGAASTQQMTDAVIEALS